MRDYLRGTDLTQYYSVPGPTNWLPSKDQRVALQEVALEAAGIVLDSGQRRKRYLADG